MSRMNETVYNLTITVDHNQLNDAGNKMADKLVKDFGRTLIMKATLIGSPKAIDVQGFVSHIQPGAIPLDTTPIDFTLEENPNDE